ncbi:hypothetical protein [Flavobacterium sp.]|uniref:hypothetical protein n=1 Tax=Flavobacterium sp. TaxID=239 RepID=UPI00262C986C|nr:hypothetical protein [Flavobacterium sp.]MDD2987022.1 hypothetical protein [Flavobacterium sp.]
MTVKICSCEGLNPKCKKCFGSGYMNTDTPNKSVKATSNDKKVDKKSSEKQESILTDNLSSFDKKEFQNIADKISASLDLKSVQQMRMLHSIPFTTTTFRRDFKDKFVSFGIMESEKRILRSELDDLTKESTKIGFSIHVKFNHLLSDKDIDVTSNRELKTLIRQYKKLKN